MSLGRFKRRVSNPKPTPRRRTLRKPRRRRGTILSRQTSDTYDSTIAAAKALYAAGKLAALSTLPPEERPVMAAATTLAEQGVKLGWYATKDLFQRATGGPELHAASDILGVPIDAARADIIRVVMGAFASAGLDPYFTSGYRPGAQAAHLNRQAIDISSKVWMSDARASYRSFKQLGPALAVKLDGMPGFKVLLFEPGHVHLEFFSSSAKVRSEDRHSVDIPPVGWFVSGAGMWA